MKLLLKGSAPYLNRERKLGQAEIDYIMLNLPYKCNYQCIKCCNRYRKYKPGNLALSEIKKIILALKKHGARVLVIAGEGEPALNKNFRSIVKFANENKLIPYIFTNGSQIDKKLAKFLAANKATLIINMDSFTPEKYDKYTGVEGAYEKVIKNLAAIRAAYRKNANVRDGLKIVQLAINLVLNKENADQIPMIKEFCNDDFVFVVNEPINIGSAHKNWSWYKNLDRSKMRGVSFPLGTLDKDHQCAYMRNGFSISSDGKILTCAYALDTQNKYGSFNSKNIRAMRQQVMSSVDDFYKKCGQSRCILRNSKYAKFTSAK